MANIITYDTQLQSLAQAIADKERNYAPMTVAQMPTRIGNIADVSSLPDADATVFNGVITSWADADWSTIASMLSRHYDSNDDFDIHDYWNIGDTRTVSLSAMPATGVGESHVAQDVEIVLMSPDHYDMTDNSGKAAFVWGLKNFLSNGTSGEWGYMESSNTNANGWHGSARRTWCQNVFKAALPSSFQALLKEVSIITATKGNARGTTTSKDYIFLPAEKEVFGTTTYANATDETSLSQYEWYKTAANRIKKAGASGSAYYWWERSPNGSDTTSFCLVFSDGTANFNSASIIYGVAPCGCI